MVIDSPLPNLLPPDLLNPEQAAEVIGVRPQTLSVWRLTGRYGLKFIKVGRLVRYRRSDLEEWLRGRTMGGEQPE